MSSPSEEVAVLLTGENLIKKLCFSLWMLEIASRQPAIHRGMSDFQVDKY